ncbi:MFS transporter [Komagataeibacter rhaeticus]|uniref:MFS transporter n=1 Tax=Komagataeibacter rhaeticus TaxID=215221 RepID=UPI0037C10079
MPVFYTMLAESIDFGAATTGIRAAGIAYSVNSFAGKVAWAVGGSLSAAMLEWGGYIPHALAQTERARAFITFGFVGLPAIIAIVSSLCILLYPSDEQIHSVLQPGEPA